LRPEYDIKDFMTQENKNIPSPWVAMLPILLLIGMLFVTIRTFGSDALGGASQVALLTTSAFCVLIGMVFYHIEWKAFEDGITKNIAGVGANTYILWYAGDSSGCVSCIVVRDQCTHCCNHR
jgi:NhaC family Na+:H+ antiporter